MKGLIAHYSTLENFNKISNFDNLVDKINQSSDGTSNTYSFILFIFGDLKNYTFNFKFVEINNNVDFKIKKLANIEKLSIDEKKNILELSEFIKTNNIHNISNEILNYYSSEILNKNNDNYLFINDISIVQTNIPSFVKSAIKQNNKNLEKVDTLNVILIKDPIYKNISKINFSKSIILYLESIKDLNKKSELENLDKIKIHTSNLKEVFNPLSIAENAVDLNINLMKWRMAPNLDTLIIKEKKFLLIGAGTLGCHVSRNLLGWGARYINFLDCGKISYSNPVRQSLYTFADSTQENNFKAEIAAKKLKEIFPMVSSEGYNLQIPLPGRTLVNLAAEESYLKTIKELETIISQHDVIFLLTDSRESRWFPTVISKNFNKIVITAAIGFDSFLVVRHGRNDIESVGCYFCNDIVSPLDTSSNRTLDQQCTISRPGISSICGGFASEIAISLLQEDNNSLGDFIPQCVRGNINDYNFLCIQQPIFKNCVACSEYVLNEYRNNRNNFFYNTMNDPYYIENICGVEKLMQAININDIEVEDDF